MRNSITPLPGGRLRKEYRGTLAWKREITLLRQMAGSGLCPELLDAPLRQAEMTESAAGGVRPRGFPAGGTGDDGGTGSLDRCL